MNTPIPIHADSNVNSLRSFSRAKPLAASLGLSARTLSRYAQKSLIKKYRLNARVTLYEIAEVRAFIEAAKV